MTTRDAGDVKPEGRPDGVTASPAAFGLRSASKIRDRHLDRLAMVYVRQSSPQQVLENRESRERQYALAQFAQRLGWPAERVVIVDEDQGQSGRSADEPLGLPAVDDGGEPEPRGDRAGAGAQQAVAVQQGLASTHRRVRHLQHAAVRPGRRLRPAGQQRSPPPRDEGRHERIRAGDAAEPPAPRQPEQGGARRAVPARPAGIPQDARRARSSRSPTSRRAG